MTMRAIGTAAPGAKGVGWAFTASLAVHGAALAAIVLGWGTSSVPLGVPVMDVELVVAAPDSGGSAGEPAATPSAPSQPTALPDPAEKPETTAAPAPQRATEDVAILLPEPEAPPPVRAEEWHDRSAPAPTTPVPPRQPPVTPAPKAAPPRPPVPPRPQASPAPQQTPSQPPAPAPQAGPGSVGTAESAGSGPPSGGARLVRHIAPVYPPLARERGLEGRVVIRLVVGIDGVPGDIRVAQSSGVESFDAAAIDAVREWRFEPARRAGVAVAEERLAPVVFRLRR